MEVEEKNKVAEFAGEHVLVEVMVESSKHNIISFAIDSIHNK